MGNGITNKYKIIDPKHIEISKSQKISQLFFYLDNISNNLFFVSYVNVENEIKRLF